MKKLNNKGSAVLVTILVLGLVIIIVSSISSIYINKINSIKNLNQYYDNKIIEKLNNG